jgi:hypothetical protein
MELPHIVPQRVVGIEADEVDRHRPALPVHLNASRDASAIDGLERLFPTIRAIVECIGSGEASDVRQVARKARRKIAGMWELVWAFGRFPDQSHHWIAP